MIASLKRGVRERELKQQKISALLTSVLLENWALRVSENINEKLRVLIGPLLNHKGVNCCY